MASHGYNNQIHRDICILLTVKKLYIEFINGFVNHYGNQGWLWNLIIGPLKTEAIQTSNIARIGMWKYVQTRREKGLQT